MKIVTVHYNVADAAPVGSSADVLWSNINYKFLFRRDVFRRHMAVVVVGPAPWVLRAAKHVRRYGLQS